MVTAYTQFAIANLRILNNRQGLGTAGTGHFELLQLLLRQLNLPFRFLDRLRCGSAFRLLTFTGFTLDRFPVIAHLDQS